MDSEHTLTGTGATVLRPGRHAVRWVGWIVAGNGLLAIAEALIRKDPEVLRWMEQWLPFEVSHGSRALLFAGGLALLGLGRGLLRRKRAAWVVTMGLMGLVPLLHLGRAFDWHHSLVGLLSVAALWVFRGHYTARSDPPSLYRSLGFVSIAALALVLYGTVTIVQERREIGGHVTVGSALQTSLELVFLQGTDTLSPSSPRARHHFQFLSVAALLTAAVGLGFLLRPVFARFTPHEAAELGRVRALVETHGRDSMAPFALLPDKRYFFCTGFDGVVAYALWRNYAVALASPLCAPAELLPAIRQYVEACRANDWEPVFWQLPASDRDAYDAAGLALLKIAEDARIPLPSFNLQGNRFQNLRTSRNKAQREGFTVHWYGVGCEQDHGLEAQFQVISESWLAAHKGPEMTFDMGRFSIAEVRARETAYVASADGRVEAFATWLTFAGGSGRALDLMRHRTESRGLMDFLLVECLAAFRDRGLSEASLGNAPLADTAGDSRQRGLPDRVLRVVFENFRGAYNYKSLFQFKEKFRPEWSARYMACHGMTSLPLALMAAVRVHMPRGIWRVLKS